MSLAPADIADDRAYRRALGAFATGVCIVTAQTVAGPLGMTINAFTSVSLNPRLILWCLDEGSSRWPIFAAADAFGVHVLPAGSEALAERFAYGICRLEPEEFTPGPDGIPLLATALTRLHCRTESRMPVGDHMVVIGEVKAVEIAPGDGLVFFKGGYQTAGA